MNPLYMASMLLQCRNTAKAILRENYQKKMEELGKALKAVAEIESITILAAAIKINKAQEALPGYRENASSLLMFAAAVELVDRKDSSNAKKA